MLFINNIYVIVRKYMFLSTSTACAVVQLMLVLLCTSNTPFAYFQLHSKSNFFNMSYFPLRQAKVPISCNLIKIRSAHLFPICYRYTAITKQSIANA